MTIYGDIIKDKIYTLYNLFYEIGRDKFNPKDFVVYTAMFGNWDRLQDVPKKFLDEGIRFVCFTDRPQSANGWEYIIDTTLDETPRMKARRYKILAHKYFPDYNYSIWIDGTHMFRTNPLIIMAYLKNDFLAFKHNKQNSVKEEIEQILKLKKDNENNIDKLLNYLKINNFKDSHGLYNSCVLIRKHNNPKFIKFSKEWFNFIKNYSVRDQLSLMYCLTKNDISFNFIDADILNTFRFKYLTH